MGEPGGGMANAIVGTVMLTGLGGLFAIPIGIMSGIYMSEYAGTKLASAARFAADTLNGVPSIVIGVFVYGIVVLQIGQFSMLAGSIALGIMMIPIIARTTEELLQLVPRPCAKARWPSAPRVRGRRSASCCLQRSRASSRASYWRSRVLPARRRRCCLPRSTTDSGTRTRYSRPPR